MELTRRLTAAVVGRQQQRRQQDANSSRGISNLNFFHREQFTRSHSTDILSTAAEITRESFPPSSCGSHSENDPSSDQSRRVSESYACLAPLPTLPSIRPSAPQRQFSVSELLSPAADPALLELLKFRNPQEEDEVLEGIQPEFFEAPGSSSDGGVVVKLLAELPDTLDVQDLIQRKRKLQRQLAVVSKRVSALILANEPACQLELERVGELLGDLGFTLSIAVSSRVQLTSATRHLTNELLSVVSNYRKRRIVEILLSNLRRIKELEIQEHSVHRLLIEESYPDAIHLVLDLQQDIVSYSQFARIKDLSAKLKDTLILAREQMDKALSKLCVNFESASYSRIQSAYALLGETQVSLDQAHLHVTQSLLSQSSSVLLGYVKMTRDDLREEDVLKMSYQELCKNIPPNVFLGCLLDLCRALWRVLWSYHCILKWHKIRQLDDTASDKSMDATLLRQYIRQKIAKGPPRVWQDLQAKIISLLVSVDLSSYTFDGFMSVVNVVHRTIEVGREFCGASCEPMEDCLRDQSLGYLRAYHRQRMEQLKLYLENEGWTGFPVKKNFCIRDIQEFYFFTEPKSVARKSVIPGPLSGLHNTKGITIETSTGGEDEEGSSEELSDLDEAMDMESANLEQTHAPPQPNSNVSLPAGFLPRGIFFGEESDPPRSQPPVNPYDNLLLWGDGDSVTGGSSTLISGDTSLSPSRLGSQARIQEQLLDEFEGEAEERDELKVNFIDEEGRGESKFKSTHKNHCGRRTGRGGAASGPLVANTTIMFLRQVGKYGRMMELLGQRSAFSVFYYITQMFNYYLYSVHKFFGVVDLRPEEHRILRALRRIERHLITSSEDVEEEREHEFADKFNSPRLPSGSDPDGILYPALVAGESVAFLAAQFQMLQSYLISVLPGTKQAFLQQFYSRIVEVAPDIRRSLCRRIAANHFRWERIIHSMSQVNWDIKDMKDRPNPYVDLIVEDMTLFDVKLKDSPIAIPTDAFDLLWQQIMKYTVRIFVEGFSLAKKCSFQGRSWMLLDFRYFLQKASNLTPVPCPPEDAAFVEEYIRAFYKSEDELTMWIPHHTAYSTHHLLGLINCLQHVSKRARQALTALVEENG